MTAPYPGPIPPETNPPLNPQYYNPSRFVISNISLGLVTLITTSTNHNYVVGQEVRVLIPSFYGTYQINGQTGFIISIPAPNQFIATINSQYANAFIPSPTYGPTKPQVIAVGDVNTGPINTNGRKNNITYIQGSFINVSPQ